MGLAALLYMLISRFTSYCLNNLLTRSLHALRLVEKDYVYLLNISIFEYRKYKNEGNFLERSVSGVERSGLDNSCPIYGNL